jgi:hypothetical protein
MTIPADPEDKSSEWQAYLNAFDDPKADLRALNLSRIRAMLGRAVLLKEYDRIDAETIGGHVVTIDYVIDNRGHEITGLEYFYNDQCLRVTFNEDENDFVNAYNSIDLACLALR